MAANVVISETNTGSTTTDNITNINFGSTDAINIVIANFPVNRGDYSFEKIMRYKLSNLSGSNSIDNFKVWLTGAVLDTGIVHDTNLTGSMLDEAYHTPIETASAQAIRVVPVDEPTNENVGKSGASGGLDANGKYSDIIYMQVETQGSANPGDQTSKNWYFQYDEQ